MPALLGVGRYTVTVELPAAAGLYPTSVVTYRGTEIGRVSSVDVTRDGVRAVLKLHSDTPVPADVSASVHSRSAVGEQFLELTPNPGAAQDVALRDGAVIEVAKAQVPADIADLLDDTNTAVQAIPPDTLRTVVDEAAKAVAGLGPELSRIVDGSTALAIEAGKTADPLTRLIDESPALLNSQVRSSDSIGSWARNMAAITGQLRAQDTAFADLLQQGGPALQQGTALFDRVAPRCRCCWPTW